MATMNGFTSESMERALSMLPRDIHDFTRCVRPNGTAYGTAGACRKGVERPEEEEIAQGSETMQMMRLLSKYGEDSPARKEILSAFNYNQSLAEKIQQLDDGSTIVVAHPKGVRLTQDIDGNEVTLELEGLPGKGARVVSFTVNGELDYGQIYDRGDRIRAALGVRNMFNMLTSSLEPGELISCAPYQDDGRGDKRLRAYKKIGFAELPGGALLGEVQEGGGVSPRYAFSEKDKDKVYWYVALFGELPPK